jgi:thioredoxin-like negative regulator of GroEL
MNIKGLISAAMVLGLSFTGFSQSQQIKDAMKMTDNEQFEKATSVFKAVMTKDSENAEVYFYMGQNLLGAEKIDTAQVVFKKGIELNSKMPLNHIGLSTTYRLKGKMTEAKSSMDAAFALLTEKGV